MMQISINPNLAHLPRDKAEKEYMAATASANGWAVENMNTLADLTAVLDAGQAIAPSLRNGHRCKVDFIELPFIALDFDAKTIVKITRDECQAALTQRGWNAVIGFTTSHTPEMPAYRAIIPLAEPITDYATAKRYAGRVVALFTGADPTSDQPERFYFGFQTGSTRILDNGHFLTLADLEALPPSPAEIEAARAAAELERREIITVTPANQTRAEAYSRAAINGILDRYLAIPGGQHLRHDAFVAMTAQLIGMQKGGWPGTERITVEIENVGRQTQRPERETADAIQWAYQNADAKPFSLPKQDKPQHVTMSAVWNDDDLPDNEPPAAWWWESGVPDEWRSELLNTDHFPPSAAPVVELINAAFNAGLLDPHAFTFKGVLAANDVLGFGLAAGTIRDMLKALTELFWILQGVLEKENTPCKFQINSTRGRKELVYNALTLPTVKQNLLDWLKPRLHEDYHPVGQTVGESTLTALYPDMLQSAVPELADLPAASLEPLCDVIDHIASTAHHEQGRGDYDQRRAVLTELERISKRLDDPSSTTLPDANKWPLNNGLNYRAAFFHAYTRDNGDVHMSYAQIEAKFGYSRAHELAKRAGLQAEPQEQDIPIKRPADIRREAQRLRGKPFWVTSQRGDSIACYEYEGSETDGRIAHELKAGATVVVTIRTANKYTVASETPVIVQPVKRRAKTPLVEQDTSESDHRPQPEYTRTHYSRTYNPAWVAAQIRLALKVLGWLAQGENLVNPTTGEIIPANAPLLDLIAHLIGKHNPALARIYYTLDMQTRGYRLAKAGAA